MKTLALAFIFVVLAALSGCEKDSGLHTGTVLKDCAYILPNQRQEVARSIEGLNKTEAAKKLAEDFHISEADAAACLQ